MNATNHLVLEQLYLNIIFNLTLYCTDITNTRHAPCCLIPVTDKPSLPPHKVATSLITGGRLGTFEVM